MMVTPETIAALQCHYLEHLVFDSDYACGKCFTQCCKIGKKKRIQRNVAKQFLVQLDGAHDYKQLFVIDNKLVESPFESSHLEPVSPFNNTLKIEELQTLKDANFS